jgi:aryl-alcohol dehydrogenase-like predicted oxidoreductase
VEASLQRLRTDYLDFLLLHSPPRELMNGSAPRYAVLDRLRDHGLIRHYGVSLREGSCAELRDVVRTTGSDAVEVRFNVLCQEPAEAIAKAGEAGVGVIVNVPLESGWLSGKYGADSRFEGARDRWSVAEIELRARLVRQFTELLPDGLSTPHGALRFILAQPGVATIIPGTKSVAQLPDNIAAADGALPAESLAAIRRLGTSEIEAEPVPW